MRRPFTPEELKYIEDNWGKKKVVDIARELDRHFQLIGRKARELGVHKRGGFNPKEHNWQRAKELFDNTSMDVPEVAQALGLSVAYLYQLGADHNYRLCRRRLLIDNAKHEEKWSEILAMLNDPSIPLQRITDRYELGADRLRAMCEKFGFDLSERAFEARGIAGKKRSQRNAKLRVKAQAELDQQRFNQLRLQVLSAKWVQS